MRKSLTEFIGTFFLCLVVLLTATSTSPLVPVAISGTYLLFIYSGGHVSGGHYNPAVSLAAWVRGRLATIDLALFIVVQMIAGVAAFYVAKQLGFTVKVPVAAAPKIILLAEGLFTFVLCSTVLNVATARNTAGNSYFGLAVGVSVLVAAIAIGSLTGAVLNPAVLVAVSLGGLIPWSLFVMYAIAHALAGIVAGVLFKFINPLD